MLFRSFAGTVSRTRQLEGCFLSYSPSALWQIRSTSATGRRRLRKLLGPVAKARTVETKQGERREIERLSGEERPQRKKSGRGRQEEDATKKGKERIKAEEKKIRGGQSSEGDIFHCCVRVPSSSLLRVGRATAPLLQLVNCDTDAQIERESHSLARRTSTPSRD